jgi:DNA-binding beta-propeller fold protein YncE
LSTGLRSAAGTGNAFGVPGGPQALAADPQTHTLYVTTVAKTIAVVNTTRCNRAVRSGCRVVASVPGQAGFTYVAVDPGTDTIYALFAGATGTGHTVQVINGARCNAGNTSHCAPVATVPVGQAPLGAALDPAAHTLYVANNTANTVSMINTATCNAAHTAGCAGPVPTVGVGAGPNVPAADPATHTLYVPNGGNSGGPGSTVSLINTATCNAATQAGCPARAPTATVGNSPFGVTIAAGTAYAWNSGSGTASLINTATCNAIMHTSCHQAKPTVGVGANTGPGAANPATHTAYTVNLDDDTLSVLDTATCTATHPSGCPATAPTLAAGGEPAFALADPATGTLYVANIVDSTVSVLNGNTCNATNHQGCRRPAPSVPQGEFLMTADPATNTLYGGNLNKPQIDVINAATCHAGNLTGCAPVAEVPIADLANVGGIDAATHTLYVADPPNTSVFMLNTAACNAENTSGCAAAPPTVKIGTFPELPVVNPATQTMYVSYGNTANKVAVVNAATCNATDTSGCGQAVVKVGQGSVDLAVSTATDTIYAPAAGLGFSGHTVDLINGATCNGTNHTGCGQLAGTVQAGPGSWGAAVNDATHTLYVTNNAGGDAPGTVSVINTAACTATNTTGCHRHFPTAATGRAPLVATLDPLTGAIYISDFSSASVTVLNGSHCNATVTSGCHTAGHNQPVGSEPFGVTINPRTRTVYVTNIFPPGSLSIFNTTQH